MHIGKVHTYLGSIEHMEGCPLTYLEYVTTETCGQIKVHLLAISCNT